MKRRDVRGGTSPGKGSETVPSQPASDTLSLAAHQLGLSLDDAVVGRLLVYVDLLQRWNAVYNLTAIRDPADMLLQHVVDCLAVVGPLRRHGGNTGRLLDVGSGAGLPGAVLAMACPGWDVTCIDAVGKKAAFVRQAAAQLGITNLRSEHGRVEDMKDSGFDVAASRAFASLAEFAEVTRNRLADGGMWLAMKGRIPEAELRRLPAYVDVFHVEQLSVPGLQAERCLVWMRPRPE